MLFAEDIPVFAGGAAGGIDLHLDADYIEGATWRTGQCEEKRWDWVDPCGGDRGGVELLELYSRECLYGKRPAVGAVSI